MHRLGWRAQSLTTTFVVGVLCALLPIGLLLGILWQQRREHDLQTAMAGLTQTAESVALIAEDSLEDATLLTRTIASAAPDRALGSSEYARRLRQIQAIHHEYTNLLIMDAAGAVLAWSGASPPTEAVLKLGHGATFGQVIDTGQSAVFFVPDAAAPDDVTAGVMAPIQGESGDVVGAVAAVFDLSAISDELHQLRSLSDQGVVLMDHEGRIVLVLNTTGRYARGPSWDNRSRAGSPEVQAALRGEVVASRDFVSPVVGNTRLAVWMPIPKYGWVAGVTWPVAAALAPSRAAEQHELLIFVTIVLVLPVGAALAARAVIRPLQRLAEHAARFGDGDFEPIRGVRSRTEIGRLAEAFNRMGQRLHQTVADLHDERAHLESVLEQLPIGVVLVSAADGRVVRMNAFSERFLSRTSADARTYDPNDPSMAFHLDGRPYLAEERALGRALRNGETVRGEELLLRLPGEPDIILNVSAAPIRDAEGRIVSAVQTIQDVTEQRLAEVRLRQQDALMRTLFEQFPGALGVLNREGRFELFFGPNQEPYSRQVVGRTTEELSPPDRLPAAKERLRRAFAGETVTAEDELYGRIFNIIVCPLRDADGSISRALVVRFDITEQRETAGKLRQQEMILRALIDQFPAVMSVVDRQYRVVVRGGQQAIVRPSSAEDLTGQDLRDVLSAEDFERFHRLAERAFAGEVTRFEGPREGRMLRGTISPLRDAAGAIDKVLSVAFDVTEEVARLERAARDEKLRALGTMAGGIAHDVNQALTLVSGYGELAREALLSGALNAGQICDMIRIMERAAYDGGATVKRLLTFARGGEQEQMQALDVGELLHDVEQLTAPRWRDATRADGNRVTLRVEAEPGLSLCGSQGALREVLTNLVFNALDAMPAGGAIVLSARSTDRRIVIDVTDSGTGMSPEVKARVFEPFYTTKGQGGTGLGMSMVFGIVERHGGQIDITSEIGRGTTIHLSFPVSEAAAPQDVAPGGVEPTRQFRVLVVDDEQRLATMLVGMLRHEGHTGETAFSAEEALARLQHGEHDLVITDLSMGDGMNGWELAAAVAGSERPIPVVLATGWGAGIDPDEAASRGVCGVVAKPYRRADLRAVIARVLAREEQAA